ncbi:hypothetical protein Sjap_021469 [Stephania japonica]|uniref:Calponin-homology (CH) domain-containing protein n=1 Tax=Stephania japonica TaxID=461633 RepID=A0AAP0ESB0_9MAGN
MGRFDEDRRVSIDSSPSTFRELDDVFLQTQARIWVGEVVHTRLDEDIPIADLLADGKLLFQLSQVTWKMLSTKCVNLRYSRAYFSESKASAKSSWKYMAYSNVDSFLKICQILGLTSIDLFSASDVVEKRNTRRVCMCIRSFSMKARSKDLNVPDFDGVTYSIAMPTDMVGCIRRSLEKSQDQFLKSSDFYDSYKGGKPRYRQKRWDDGDGKCDDSYFEEFQDSGNNYQELGLDCQSSSTSHDDASLLFSDEENSPCESLIFTENLILTCSTLQSTVHDQEKGVSNSIENEPTNLAEWSPSTSGMSNDDKVPGDVINEVSDCRLDRRSSDNTEFVIMHPTTSQNSISCEVDTECQLKELFIDVIPLGTCSEHVHRLPVPFSEYTHWVNGNVHANTCNTEVASNVLYGVPAVKDGEECIDHAMSGNDPTQFSCSGASIYNCAWHGNASKDITVQQSFIRDHLAFADYSMQHQALSHSVLDIPEDKHVLPSSVSIQPAESVRIVLDDPDAYSGRHSSVTTYVGYQETQKSGLDASEEKTGPPSSVNIKFKESDCLLADHVGDETEKGHGQSVNRSVVHSVALKCADVPDIGVCVSDKDCLSDEHSVKDDNGGIQFMSISTKADESGGPSLYLEHDNVEACIYQYPVVKNITDETGIAVGNVEEDEEKCEKGESCNRTKEPKSHKKVLLKSVAGGVALIGVYFFLFNRRRKCGNGDAYRSTPSLSIQVRKGDQVEVTNSKPNEQKTGRMNGVYPGDKLKFLD